MLKKMPKGSKEGTDKLLYVGSKKKKRYKLIYLQNSSRVADVEDKLIEGGGRGVHVWERMYTRGGFMSMYGKTNTVL